VTKASEVETSGNIGKQVKTKHIPPTSKAMINTVGSKKALNRPGIVSQKNCLLYCAKIVISYAQNVIFD
jgi:hypothetical protein